jgi:DNA-binding NarL/FixJ family response regulator
MIIEEHLAPHPAALHVFIVEGSSDVRERLKELVGSIEGARCAGTASTVAEALGGIHATRPDAVILDIGISAGHGFDVIRALHGSHPDLPIYVLSNFVLEPYRRLAAKLGATAFFDKSTQIESIRAVLAERAAQHTTLTH